VFWSSRKSVDLEYQFERVSIHPTTEIGEDVEIGPFSVIGPNCRIGDGCRLGNNVTLVTNTVLGMNNEIFPGAVLGADPQDKKYEGEPSWLLLGDGNTVREHVTINTGTRQGGGKTIVGSRNLLMAGCHVAHDCVLEDGIILANNVLLGGHVRVESFANLGGMAAVHHFATVGRQSFVGGMSRVSQDVPPFMLMEGNPCRARTINKVGLLRRGVSEEVQAALKEAHRVLFRSGLPRGEGLAALEERHGDVDEVRYLIEFLRRSERGDKGRARQP
jgi:UDP-N-acetylglucosamine acyltransferase